MHKKIELIGITPNRPIAVFSESPVFAQPDNDIDLWLFITEYNYDTDLDFLKQQNL